MKAGRDNGGSVCRRKARDRYTAGAIGTLAGPKLAGDGFDLFHSYSLPILVSAGCAFVAAVLILLLPKPAIIQDPGV
jgi:hypothetical protein